MRQTLRVLPEYNQEQGICRSITAVYIHYIMRSHQIVLVSFIQPCSDKAHLYTLAFTEHDIYGTGVVVSISLTLCMCGNLSHTTASGPNRDRFCPSQHITLLVANLTECPIVKSYCAGSYGQYNGPLSSQSQGLKHIIVWQ